MVFMPNLCDAIRFYMRLSDAKASYNFVPEIKLKQNGNG